MYSYYFLIAKHCGKGLDVALVSTEDGGDNQKWKIK